MAEGDRAARHPGPAELESFLLGEMTPRQAAPLVAHLIGGCEQCRVRMAPMAAVLFGADQDLPEPAEETGSRYDFPLFKAFAATRRLSAGARETTNSRPSPVLPLLKEVSTSPALAQEEKTVRDWARCEALLDQCLALRSQDPEMMVLTAEFAVKLAERLDTGPERNVALSDLRSRAWAELGNARRVADDLAAAESDLGQALKQAEQGTGDPLLLAQIMHLTASLYIDQRRFDEAQRLLDGVYAIHRQKGDLHAAGRTLVSKGVSAGYALDSECAVRFLQQALREIDVARDPKLVFAAIHNLLWCLVDCGRVADAHRLLKEARPLYLSYGERFDGLKARWLDGRIAASQGDGSKAELLFLEVRAGFEETELFYDAALVSMDLAATWLSQGRTTEMYKLVENLVEVFQSRNIRREAIAALLLLKEALQKNEATADLLRTVAAELWRLERFPCERHGARL